MGYKSKFYQSGAHLDETKYENPKSTWAFPENVSAVPSQEQKPNTNQVSRDQGILDSYRQRVEDDRNTALASMGNQGVPTGQTLIEKATGGLGQAGTIPQQKSVRQYLGLDPTEQQEETPKPKSTLELLEQQREENAKKITEGVLPEKQTASFLTWLDSKAGQVNRGVTKAIDVVANAIPMLEGAIMGENPDSTLTGQLLKPLTDATGKLDEWTAMETENATKLVDEAIGDNKALRLASDVGGGVITALPNAALAMMTGGASAGGTIGSQLAPQASGLAGTVSAAWQKLISNPMFQTSFIQGLGSGYEEAKEAGASDVNAMAAALLSTTANSIVEVGGGVETLPGELKNADLSTGKKALQWLTSALDEGKEEVVQGAISSMVNKAASGSDTPYFSMTDENAVVNPLRMGQEFGMGAAVGGILGGGQVLANSMLQKAYANRSGNGQDAAIQKIFDDNNKKFNIDNTESQAYNGINENGGALDGRNNQLDGASGEGVRAGRGGSWTDSGSQDGRRFGQDDLSVPGIVLLSPEAQQTLTERGIVNVELHDSSMDNTAFSAALDAARVADSQNGWAVTPKDANELTEAGTRTFLDRNGSAGFAIASDGDIEAVFANKTAGAPKGATKSTIPQAIANGGTKLDCYGHGLVRLYGRYGFIPVARVTFNPEYANPGWTADKGMPDIYFMMHNGDSADTVVQNMGKYKTWSKAELEALPLMEYDEAYKYRDSLMNSGNGSIWKLDAAIRETLKPAQDLENLNNAIDGLFAQNKTAQADTVAESTNVNTNPDSMPKVTMADFTDRLSAVFNNLEYGDTKTQTEITQKTHQDMVSSGEVVKIPESTLEQTESYYPDLRGMKKQERAPILKQKITELKTVLRKFLNGMKGGTYEFEVNGNILEAKLYDTGVREVMDKITQNKASMLLHSEEVFKNARYLYSTPDYEGDPNIYRWNYFYTPVDIGGETVGVRIAVRDIALGQNNIPESQIYNWNIKKDAALGGEKLGTNAASPDTSSAASDNNSIRGNSENVNGKSNMEQAVDALFPGLNENTADMDHGAVGAAESGFSPYSHYQNQTDNFMPEGAYAARPVDMPAVDPTGKPVRSGAKTIYGAQTTSDARAEQMETEFMEGLYGYDPVRDKPTLEKAKQTIAQEGYDQAYARVKERLQSMKKLKETGLEAYLLYADAVKNGNDADAAELCLLLTQSGTEFGQGVQLFSMFRKLSPEGQLLGVERMVQRVNEKYAGSDKKTAIPDYARNDVIKEITDVRDTALRLLENIQAVFDKTGQNHGVPVEDWIQEIGDRLAKSLEKTSENSSQLTVSKTIQNDLRRFAKSYFDRKKPGNRYSNAQALENFLNNRDQYTEAWDEARWYLSNKYQNDPSMLDALNDFLTSGINIESIGSGIDTDIKKAMNDIGVKTKDIIRKSNADKDSTSKQIAEMLMKDHNLSNEDADTMANFIIDRFNQHISDASELVLKNRFAPKDKKAKKTFDQNFYELANMGAFTNENWKDAVSKKLFGHEISIDETLISEFRNAQDQDTRDAVMEKIYENIGKQIPTTASEAINQWRYTAMLLNPSTHIKNMGGNLSMMAMKLGKDAIGTGIEAAANKITGGKVGRTKAILNVFNKSDQALMQKAWADYENVQDDVAGIGKNKDNIMGKVGEYRDYWKLNDPQGNAAKLVDGVLRGAEKVPKFNSAMMDAEDMIFSRPDYAVSLAGYMKANKLTEITPEARAYAIKEAQKATFRDANAVSNFARKMGTGDHKFWNFLINSIFPFKGTPANVGVRAFEYSPAGLLKALTYDIYRVKKGNISATEYIDNLSSGLTGSALSAVGYFLAQAGFLRATGVGDEKEKEQQRQQGYKDNSFTLFGYSIPENVFTSASAPMFVGAALYEALATKALSGEAYSIDDVLQVLAATADPILGQNMLDGLSDTFYTIRSAQGGMGQVAAALAVNIAGNYISSFMPTILSRISSAADSVGRETYADNNKPLTGIQKEVQDLMMKTPARQLLHEKVDNYGRVQETWKPFGDDNAAQKALNFAANVVTPTYPSKIKDTPVEDELNRLYRSGADTSDKKIFQTEAAKSFKVDGKTINLTADQHEEFEKIRGENTIEYQGALQDSEQYNNLDDSLKIYATDKMYDFIEQTSKDLLGIGYDPDDWVSELKGKSQEEIAETVIMKTMESYAKSDNFSSKYDGITSMLDSGTIDAAMAVSLLPEQASSGYYKYIKGSGIELSVFIDVYQFKKNAKQEEVIEYINKVGKGPGQKRRMFLAMGYSEKNLPEEWK